MAAAELEKTHGQSISGKDLLLAYIIGCEIGPRVGLALHGADLLSRGWHSGTLQGHPAATAATSSLLHLQPKQIESALGTACTQACGLMSAQFGSMVKRMQHGFAARNGLFATLMAREGYSGIDEVFEVPYGGFLSCSSQGANFEPKALPEEIVSGLGHKWGINGIRVKLHAAMAALHAPIDCTEKLQKIHPDLLAVDKLAHIESIETRHGKAAFEHGGWIAPADAPMTSTGAQMPIQYAVAAQLLDGQVWMEQFAEDKLNRPEIRALMALIKPVHDVAIDG